jgi:RNA polymerase sigma factor (sigma-70 family)
MSTDAPVLLGDEAQLFRLHAGTLRSVVTRQVRTSSANIEDACAFAWVQFLRYQPPRDRLMGWLCRTAIREAITLDRRGCRCTELTEDPDVGPQLATNGSMADERLELLVAREAIAAAQLRDREADLLVLQLAGYSYAETARLRNLTQRTVERQLLRARRKLRSARLAQHE